MTTDEAVLIVGAGPTGLVLAAELARNGVRPRVIDAGPAEVRESRAVAVVARSLELLDDLGVADAAVDRGIPLRALAFYEGTTRVAQLDTTAVDSPFPMDLCIPQWQTVGLLRDRVEQLGVEIEWGTRLVSYRDGGSGIVAEVARPDGRTEQVEAAWLVGCDGAHSTVRDIAGIGRRTADLRRSFVLGDVRADWDLVRDRFHVWFGRHGLVAVFPMPGGHWRILADTAEARPPARPGISAFIDRVAARTPLDARLRDLQWSSGFVAREGLADRFRSGRVLLAGDAAHHHSPIGGQGMNTGMQDAYNLGWKLALAVRGETGDSLVDSYEAERRPVAGAVIDATSTATRVATGRCLVARRARHHALRLSSRIGAVQRTFSAAIGEHLVNYRDSAIVAEHWPAARNGGIRAGEVVPDAYVETRTGPAALRHVLRGPGHHLVLFAADETDPGTLARWRAGAEEVMAGRGRVSMLTRGHLPSGVADRVLTDVRGRAHDRFGVRRPGFYLVRPDKYVGYRSDGIALDRVRGYFAALGVAPATGR